jgi:hypothetical protein
MGVNGTPISCEWTGRIVRPFWIGVGEDAFVNRSGKD